MPSARRTGTRRRRPEAACRSERDRRPSSQGPSRQAGATAALRSRVGRTILLPGLLAAAVAGWLLAPAGPLAAPPGGAAGSPKRFLDSLLGRKTPPPQFIAAPTPPTAADVEAMARLAATPKPTRTVPDTVATDKTPVSTKGAGDKTRKQSATGSAGGTKTDKKDTAGGSGGATPPKAGTAETPPPSRLPSWSDTVEFAASLKQTARKVATSALGSGTQPAERPGANRSAAAAVSRVAAGSSEPADDARPTAVPPPKTRRFERLRVRIAQTLAAYQRRPLNTSQHTPWEVMHGFIAFGIPTRVRVGGPAGDPVNAIGWMNMAGRCRGQVMLATVDDRLVAMRGIGVQGHSAQYLAILAQCRVALNSPITVQSKSFTVADLVEEEKRSCKSGTELTFALIALAHYLPTDAAWKSRDGRDWSLEKLMSEEIEQPIRGAPCGGTHRLFGLAYGCQRRLKATGRLDGVYLRADKFVRDYQKFTLTKLQNPDGSFSTEWFKYPADRADDVDRKVQTTGHILEWLVASLDQQSLY
ncbi:MAG: hypothetical protein EBZ59_10725, partial [Planctomycetia bacterium]|nr:hypothetical protein [Planctomycetia bacterium]